MFKKQLHDGLLEIIVNAMAAVAHCEEFTSHNNTFETYTIRIEPVVHELTERAKPENDRSSNDPMPIVRNHKRRIHDTLAKYHFNLPTEINGSPVKDS